MILTNIQSDELFNVVTKLSKLSKNGKSPNISIYNNEGVIELCSSGELGSSVALVQGGIDNSEKSLLPITIIPFLSVYGKNDINLDINDKRVIIRCQDSVVTLQQYGEGYTDRLYYEPDWVGLSLNKLNRINISAGADNSGYEYYWIHDDTIICSDRYRVSVMYLKKPITDKHVILPTYAGSMIYDNDIDFSVDDKYTCIGNPGLSFMYHTSLSSIPDAIRKNSVKNNLLYSSMSSTDFINSIRILALSASKDNIVCYITMNDDGISMSIDSNHKADIHNKYYTVSDDPSTRFVGKVSVRYLSDLIKTISNPVVELGKTELNFFRVNDGDVSHIIVPMS